MTAPALPPPLREIAAHLPAGCEAYLVGGAVRDLLLGRPVKDLDLAVPRGGLALARRLADALGAAFVALDDQRGVGRVVWERNGERLEVDIADFRAADLEGDLRARDLTINALALPLGQTGGASGPLIDPAGGGEDLRAGVVRLLSAEVLRDDPLRGLRAVRLGAQLGFRIDDASRRWIAAQAPALGTVAAERVRDELWKCLVAPAPATTLRQLDELGLLAVVVPEAAAAHDLPQSPPHRQDVWEHTLAVVEQTAGLIAWMERGQAPPLRPKGIAEALPGLAGDDGGVLASALAPFAAGLAARLAEPLAADHAGRGHLLLGALFHDLGKPPTQSVGGDGRIHFHDHEEVGARLAEARLVALRFAQPEVQRVVRIVRHHMRPLQLLRAGPLPARIVHRFHRATGDIATEVCLLSLADNLAKGAGKARGAWPAFVARIAELLDAFFFRHDELVAPPPLVSGGELLSELGRPPGPWVGELLRALAEAQAAGEVGTRDEALRFARQWQTGGGGDGAEVSSG